MDNPENWLIKRLSPKRSENPRWVQMAEAIQEFWDENFEPSIEQYENLRSIFTADEEGIDQRLSELGSKFEVALPILPTSKAVAYAMRGYEIHRKDRRISIEQILQRDFKGAVVRWLPLYAVIGESYGTRFLTDIEASEAGFTDSELYLTNRGKTLVNAPAAHDSGYSNSDIQDAVDRKLVEIKPLHIVYEGVQFISIFIGTVDPTNIINPYNFIIQKHPIDANTIESIALKKSGEKLFTVNLDKELSKNLWRMDMGWWINGDYRRREGVEGDEIGLISNLASDSFRRSIIDGETTKKFEEWLKSISKHILAVPQAVFASSPVIIKSHPVSIGSELISNPWRMDMGWLISGKFRMLPGNEGDVAGVINKLGDDSKTRHLLSLFEKIAARNVKSESGSVKNIELLPEEMRKINVTNVKYKLYSEEESQSMPRLDDVPLDFAPLDMYYDEV